MENVLLRFQAPFGGLGATINQTYLDGAARLPHLSIMRTQLLPHLTMHHQVKAFVLSNLYEHRHISYVAKNYIFGYTSVADTVSLPSTN